METLVGFLSLKQVAMGEGSRGVMPLTKIKIALLRLLPEDAPGSAFLLLVNHPGGFLRDS